jgi:hypothetical protein
VCEVEIFDQKLRVIFCCKKLGLNFAREKIVCKYLLEACTGNFFINKPNPDFPQQNFVVVLKIF